MVILIYWIMKHNNRLHVSFKRNLNFRLFVNISGRRVTFWTVVIFYSEPSIGFSGNVGILLRSMAELLVQVAGGHRLLYISIFHYSERLKLALCISRRRRLLSSFQYGFTRESQEFFFFFCIRISLRNQSLGNFRMIFRVIEK